MERARQQYGMTERHACRLLEQWRGTQRYEPIQRNDEDALTRAIYKKRRSPHCCLRARHIILAHEQPRNSTMAENHLSLDSQGPTWEFSSSPSMSGM